MDGGAEARREVKREGEKIRRVKLGMGELLVVRYWRQRQGIR